MRASFIECIQEVEYPRVVGMVAYTNGPKP